MLASIVLLVGASLARGQGGLALPERSQPLRPTRMISR